MTTIASCGCTLKQDEECEQVMFKGEQCDPIDGFGRAVVYASYCPSCAKELRADKDYYLPTVAEADAWLDGRERAARVAAKHHR